MNPNNFLTTFSLNSNTGYLATQTSIAPDINNFPPYIQKNFTLFNFTYLRSTILKYFADMTSEYNSYAVGKIIESENNLDLMMSNFEQLMTDAEWQDSAKIPSNGTLFNVTQNIGVDQIQRFRELFNELYAVSCSDPNVENYSKIFMSKAVRKFNNNYEEMGDGKRLKNLISFIASGVTANALVQTKTALAELESYTIQLFPGDIVQRRNLRSMKESVRTNSMINSVTEDRDEILKGGVIKGQALRKYVNSATIQIQQMTQPASSPGIIGSFVRTLLAPIISAFRKSGLRKTIVLGSVSLLAISSGAQPTKKCGSTGISNLNISVTENSGELYINFSGNLANTNIGGSFSISANSLWYPAFNAFYEGINLDNSIQLRIVQRIGTEIINPETIWASFSVFLYTYLSICVYCMLNPDNIFGIQIDQAGRENINFMIQEDFMNEMTVEFSTIYPLQPQEIKNILNYAAVGCWATLMWSTL